MKYKTIIPSAFVGLLSAASVFSSYASGLDDYLASVEKSPEVLWELVRLEAILG